MPSAIGRLSAPCVESQLLRHKCCHQAFDGLARLLVVDLLPEPSVAGDGFVDFVALVAHGPLRIAGGSALGSHSPMPKGPMSAMIYNRRRGLWFLIKQATEDFKTGH